MRYSSISFAKNLISDNNMLFLFNIHRLSDLGVRKMLFMFMSGYVMLISWFFLFFWLSHFSTLIKYYVQCLWSLGKCLAIQAYVVKSDYHTASPPLLSNPPKRTEQHDKYRRYFCTCRIQTGKSPGFGPDKTDMTLIPHCNTLNPLSNKLRK